ncbi:MAG: hypothetical protein A2Z88_03535 [Omnitrophica WOR_2 bacterium GWA2_47_8]|nr:MAG: hypothetical protein A2Z88_03535 [Omnitrophica WOR_2 bacterium GWA2_47_8]
MSLIIIYSILLVLGIFCSQMFHLDAVHGPLHIITNICLAYIMMEVGLEFFVDKKKLKGYAKDSLLAFLAAVFPWVFCAGYFILLFKYPWQQAFLLGIFSAPTSAGILFAMLAAAGLGTSWVFRKAQVLAVFDDFVAILLLIPFQVFFIGLSFKLFVGVFLMVFFLVLAFQRQHSLRLPSGQYALISYSVIIVMALYLIYQVTKIDLGALVPAFSFGALLYNPHHGKAKDPSYDEPHQEPKREVSLVTDRLIKGSFMFLVGCSLPKIQLQDMNISVFIAHVLALTVLSNVGKSFLFFCYRREASWKDRLALSIAMFPRGEVGAGVLLIAMGYGLSGIAVPLSILSLALNLVLTGVFITLVISLAQKRKET